MVKRNGVALMGLFLIVTCLPAMLLAVDRRIKAVKAELPAATVEAVDMFQAMDSGQIDALGDIFTEDAVCEFGPEYGNWEGRETIRANYRSEANRHVDNAD